MPPTKHNLVVLFMHGLFESTPYGNKYKHLCKKFKTVKSVPMQTGVLTCGSNSFLKHLVKQADFYVVIMMSLSFLLAIKHSRGVWAEHTKGSVRDSIAILTGTMTLLCCFCYVQLGTIFSLVNGLRNSVPESVLRSCMEIQAKAVKKYEPDVIVASSFGGAVAFLSLMEGHFKVPCVLCAPPVDVAPEYYKSLLETKPLPRTVPIVIVHGTKDSVVEIDISRKLVGALKGDAERTKAKALTKLVECDDDSRGKAWIIEEVKYVRAISTYDEWLSLGKGHCGGPSGR